MSSDNDTSVGLLIAQIYRQLLARSAEALHPLGLNNPQLLCMKVLAEHPGISNVEIASELVITPQAVTALQRSLREMGLVKQQRSSTDSRVLMTKLTAKGKKVFNDYEVKMRAADEKLLEVLPVADRKRIKRMLTTLKDSQSRHIK